MAQFAKDSFLPMRAPNMTTSLVNIGERTLRSGRRVKEVAEELPLTISTRCPEKWVAVDLETGEAWAGTPDGWRRVRDTQRREAASALDMRLEHIVKRRFRSRDIQHAYEEMIAHAVRQMGDFFHDGKPSTKTSTAAAFWDGYRGDREPQHAKANPILAIAYAAGKDYAEANPGVFDFVPDA